MSAPHSPGPWKLWDTDIDGDGFAHSDWPHVMTSDGTAVCDLCDWGSLELDEQRDNARLIAAAPELYQALLQAQEYLHDIAPAMEYDANEVLLRKARGEA